MDVFPVEELRRLCKDERSFRELMEWVQQYLAISASGTGKEFWSAFLDHTGDLILETDFSGKIINVHSAGELGANKQFLGRNLKFYVPRLIAGEILPALQKVHSTHQPERLFADEEEKHPFLVLSPVFRDGVLQSVLAVFPAAKFRLDMKKRISETEKKYRYLFENANDGILITDPESHQIVDLNEVIAKRLGYKVEEMPGMKVEQITPEEVKGQLPDIRKVLSTKGQAIFETLQLTSDGKLLPVEISSRLIRYRGKPAYLNFVRDISDRKRTEELLVRKGDELNAFVYRASHDLKGPIATIRGLLMVASAEIQDAASRYYFDLLNRAAVRLDNNLTDLIQITTIHRVPLTLMKVDFNEIISEVIHELSAQFDLDVFQISLEVNQKKPFMSDRKMVRTILLNLLSNAMKYSLGTGRDPEVRIKATSTLAGMEIRVGDNGNGIPEKAKEKIFDMFFRADNKVQGSGLGLTILKSTVQKLGGEVSVESRLGLGSEFRVELPSLSPAGNQETVRAV